MLLHWLEKQGIFLVGILKCIFSVLDSYMKYQIPWTLHNLTSPLHVALCNVTNNDRLPTV